MKGCGSLFLLFIIIAGILIAIGLPGEAAVPMGLIITGAIVVIIWINNKDKENGQQNTQVPDEPVIKKNIPSQENIKPSAVPLDETNTVLINQKGSGEQKTQTPDGSVIKKSILLQEKHKTSTVPLENISPGLTIDFSDCHVPADLLAKYIRNMTPEDCLIPSNIQIVAELLRGKFGDAYTFDKVAGMIRYFLKTIRNYSVASTQNSLSVQRARVESFPSIFQRMAAEIESAHCSTADDLIKIYMRITKDEEQYSMINLNSLVMLIKKIFPNESCTSDNISEYIRRLAIKNVGGNNEHFAPVQQPQANQNREYSPEKISPKPAAKKLCAEPYATFKKMKRIGGVQDEYWSYYSDNAETFYKQAQFMVDFVDNYDQEIPLDTYYSTYGKMDDAQLRTYFTWRTKVRQGIVKSTSLSYAFCYIFELINDIGVSSPADAIDKLITLWTAFRQYNGKLDSYMREWIRDYYVVHKPRISVEFSEYSCRFPVPYHDEDMDLMAKAKLCSWDDLHVIEGSSSFKITNGQFYKNGNQKMIENCSCFVIRELAMLFKRGGVDFRNVFFESRREKVYSLFNGAVHREAVMQPITVQLDEFEAMKLNSGGWYREYISLTQYRTVIGYILKCIEVKMRFHFGYRRNLQMPNIFQVENCFLNSEPDKFNYPARPSLDKLKTWKAKAFSVINNAEFETAIVRAIADYCKTAHIIIQDGVVKENKPVEIDMSKLKVIEKEHNETAAKLILEEQQEPVAEAPSPALEEIEVEISGIAGLGSFLSDDERSLLTILLDGEQAPPNSELLIETINEKALEAIADNIIDYSEGVPYVYDDYTDELKSSLGGK